MLLGSNPSEICALLSSFAFSQHSSQQIVVIPVNRPLVLAVTMSSSLVMPTMMLAVEAAVVLAKVATVMLSEVTAVVARVEVRAVIVVERQEWREVLSVVAVVMTQSIAVMAMAVMAIAVPVPMTVAKTVTTISAWQKSGRCYM